MKFTILLDDNLLRVLIFLSKRFIDWLRGLHYSKCSNVNAHCCNVHANTHFVFKYLSAYLNLTVGSVYKEVFVNFMYTIFLSYIGLGDFNK